MIMYKIPMLYYEISKLSYGVCCKWNVELTNDIYNYTVTVSRTILSTYPNFLMLRLSHYIKYKIITEYLFAYPLYLETWCSHICDDMGNNHNDVYIQGHTKVEDTFVYNFYHNTRLDTLQIIPQQNKPIN